MTKLSAIEVWLTERTGMSGDDLRSRQGLFTSGDLDSFDLVELVALLETSLGRRIPAIDLVPRNFDSLEKIEAYCAKARGQ
jgi:acyl carrier protein